MAGRLAGIRVLDLTSVVSGPLATMFLADQGADVIKIEPLGGDITRHSRQSISESGEFSALFVSTNRGKRSLSLDLKQPEAGKTNPDGGSAAAGIGAELPARPIERPRFRGPLPTAPRPPPQFPSHTVGPR